MNDYPSIYHQRLCSNPLCGHIIYRYQPEMNGVSSTHFASKVLYCDEQCKYEGRLQKNREAIKSGCRKGQRKNQYDHTY